MESKGMTLEGLGAILAVIVSFIALLGTMFSNKKQLNDSLDSKSGWRKELFDVASKEEISIEELYRVRSALRIFKHNHRLIKYSFDWMTNFIIIVLDFFIENCEEQKSIRLIPDLQTKFDMYTEEFNVFGMITGRKKSDGNLFVQGELSDYVCPKYIRDITRIFARYLLKNHWDYNLTMMPNNSILKRVYTNKSQKIAKQTFLQVIKLLMEEDSLMSEENAKVTGETITKEKLIEDLNNFIKETDSQSEKIDRWGWITIPISGIASSVIGAIILIWSNLINNEPLSLERSIFLVGLFLFSMVSYFIFKDLLKSTKSKK